MNSDYCHPCSYKYYDGIWEHFPTPIVWSHHSIVQYHLPQPLSKPHTRSRITFQLKELELNIYSNFNIYFNFQYIRDLKYEWKIKSWTAKLFEYICNLCLHKYIDLEGRTNTLSHTLAYTLYMYMYYVYCKVYR